MKNLKDCCASLAASGYGTVAMSTTMMQSDSRLLQEYRGVDSATKARYSFAQDTDGFLPYGLEYAQDKSKLANPQQHQGYVGFWHRRPVDLGAAMNRAHVGFGNEPIGAAASPTPVQIA
ncbi:hypothetical protein GALL_444340 [mine drainage metagenome]|uniref:Uncharacterized protein n=1 Tax=mine drainage metagenome TaxID=410659 RepID=A0A1J5PSY5_9ZZZZ